MQYSGSTCVQIVTKMKFIIFNICVFKRLECSNKPKISGEQAQNYLAFHMYLDSEIALKFHKFDIEWI